MTGAQSAAVLGAIDDCRSHRAASSARKIRLRRAGKTGLVPAGGMRMEVHNMSLLLELRRIAAVAGLLALAALGVTPAFAQSAPLEFPFVTEWAGSPHARASAEAFIHWNEEGEIPLACAKCHSTPGFRDFVGADGSEPGVVNRPAPTGTVIACVACHNDATIMMSSVTFPSGLTVENVGDDSRCMTCHQGRESTVSVNEKIAGMTDDEVQPKLGFVNVHYRAAGATRFGTQAKGGYEYDGQTYKGYYGHNGIQQRCADCHEQHALKVRFELCATCHVEAGIKSRAELSKIRMTPVDFDGDGNVEEGMAEEIATLQEALLKAIQSYATEVAKTPIAYDSHNHPYFFADTNADGKADRSEAIFPNRYQSWTPRLLRAAYNYQFAAKDPGAYAHNGQYVIQLLVDSLQDLSGKAMVDTSKLIRPES